MPVVNFNVGRTFPIPQYLAIRDNTVCIPEVGFFGMYASLNGITNPEIKAWKHGRLSVSLFTRDSVPYVIFDFGGGFILDISLNIKKLNPENINKWLNPNQNTVHLFLVESRTGILKAGRIIGLNQDIANGISNILTIQNQKTMQEIEDSISETYEEITATSMIRNANYHQHFYRPMYFCSAINLD